MVKLFCAIVGVAGSLFSVRVDEHDSVDDLKDAIKAKNPDTIKGEADQLQLFLAKTADDKWLSSRLEDVKKLKKGEKTALVEALTDEVKELQGEDPLEDLLNGMDPPSARQVHVLVVIPDGGSGVEATRQTKLTSLSMMLKQCKVVGDLPQEGEFLNLFEWTDGDCGTVVDITVIDTIVHFTGPSFYVRKEILCVLEIFKSVYRDEFDTGKVGNMQFVLMGSPGTGKSCILALLCFYIAVRYKRPVIWFRRVNGGLNLTFTRLFYKGKYYEWLDDNGKIFESIYDAMVAGGIKLTESWFCLDGMTESEVKENNWQNRFKLLATSGQFSPNSEAMQFTKRCLVPYWKRRDLEDFGLNHMQMHESDVDARYFVSGGSLRDFLGDNGRDVVKAAMANIAGPGDAEMLLTANGASSRQQIDHIRMRGVQQVSNVEHYVDTDKWSCSVSSKFALQRLAAVMMPDFFEKLMGIAKGMNDDRLEAVAFEGYFHSLVRHRRSIRVEYCKYDNVDRRTDQDWGAIMSADVGSIELNGHSLVKCEGGNRRECVAVMESWAANPSTMSYWIPATSLCETIDAVARWTFPDGVERFCFLQLTKATTHKCDAAILWELAQPFVNMQLQVCYLALLPTDPDEDKRRRFRLNPAVITQQAVLDHLRLYVAHFQVMPWHASVNTTTS